MRAFLTSLVCVAALLVSGAASGQEAKELTNYN